MNTALLTRIAEWLEAGAPADPEYGLAGFNMADTIKTTECGSVCCIAGAAIVMSGRKCLFGVMDAATSLLELSDDDANDLFLACGVDLSSIDPAWAARCVRRMIETGKVDWKGTRSIDMPGAIYYEWMRRTENRLG